MKNKLNENPNAMIPPNEWEKYKDNPKKSSYQPSPIHYDENNNIPFGYLKDGTLIIGKYSSIHDTIGKGKERLGRSKNSGRIFTNYKVITFWNFPSDYNELVKVIKDLENKTKLNILNDPEWLIEIPSGEFKKALEDEDIKSWGSWRPKIIDQKFIPIKDYKGGYTRSKEEMEIDHVKSPLLKQKTPPHGYGSKNPNYKPLAWRQALYVENKKEIYKNKINESPDTFKKNDKYYSVSTPKSYPFTILRNNNNIIEDIIIGEESTYHHENIELYVKSSHIYPGRIFVNQKVITFWTYPSDNELIEIIHIFEKILKIKIFNNNWFIEIYSDNNLTPVCKGNQSYSCKYDRTKESQLIPIEKYIKSKNVSSEEYEDHLKSPLLKQKNVPYGYGSKNPKYKPLAWRQAMYAESYYPILKSDLLNGD